MISVSINNFNNQSVLMCDEHLSSTCIICKMTQFEYKFHISKMSFDLFSLGMRISYLYDQSKGFFVFHPIFMFRVN